MVFLLFLSVASGSITCDMVLPFVIFWALFDVRWIRLVGNFAVPATVFSFPSIHRLMFFFSTAVGLGRRSGMGTVSTVPPFPSSPFTSFSPCGILVRISWQLTAFHTGKLKRSHGLMKRLARLSHMWLNEFTTLESFQKSLKSFLWDFILRKFKKTIWM